MILTASSDSGSSSPSSVEVSSRVASGRFRSKYSIVANATTASTRAVSASGGISASASRNRSRDVSSCPIDPSAVAAATSSGIRSSSPSGSSRSAAFNQLAADAGARVTDSSAASRSAATASRSPGTAAAAR